jgi:N-acetyl-gamma-glutamyl-phosphate reductase
MPSHAEAVATRTVGLVGARGHVGRELLALVARHPRLSLAFASSRAHAGAPLPDGLGGGAAGASFIELAPASVAERPADVYVLALPNGAAAEWVDAIERAGAGDALIVDLSADHRFDSAWTYGLPELNGDAIRAASRIANPGCYATAMMLALAPLADRLDAPPHCFGVSGYSGAGSTPSPRNDPDLLRDNLMPYALTGHVHEREVSHQLGRDVHFMPHVGPFFRGISMTVSARLTAPVTVDDLAARATATYALAPFVRVTPSTIPLLRDAVGRFGATVGGFGVSERDARDVRVVSTLDNLLKGAASQAVQNVNLACGWDAQEGLVP